MPTIAEQEAAAILYRERITDEIIKALGFSTRGVFRRALGPLFRIPAGRFGAVAAKADAEIPASGLSGGCRRLLAEMSLRVTARGSEKIPADGPLLLVSNHPGAYDSVAIMAGVPRRDLKVILSDVPFTRDLAEARVHFIYAPLEAAGRAAALRASIEHLQTGGALLFFPHDDVEPDPEASPGAADTFQNWSRSIEIMLRQVPETRLQVAIAGNILSPRFLRHPLVKIRRSAAKRQKLAFTLQIVKQMAFPRNAGARPCVHLSFAAPVAARKILNGRNGEAMGAVRKIAAELLADHLAYYKSA